MGQIGGNKRRKCAAAREKWNAAGSVNVLAIVDNAGVDPSCARGPREVQCDLGEAESSRERLVDSQLVGSVSCGAGRGRARRYPAL